MEFDTVPKGMRWESGNLDNDMLVRIAGDVGAIKGTQSAQVRQIDKIEKKLDGVDMKISEMQIVFGVRGEEIKTISSDLNIHLMNRGIHQTVSELSIRAISIIGAVTVAVFGILIAIFK